jgi:hypothetical protein
MDGFAEEIERLLILSTKSEADTVVSSMALFFSSFFFLLYYSYVISPLAPTPSFITHSAPSLSRYPLATQQKLFCPYL